MREVQQATYRDITRLSGEQYKHLMQSLEKLEALQQEKQAYRMQAESCGREMQMEFRELVAEYFEAHLLWEGNRFLKRGETIEGARQIAEICTEYLYFVFGDGTFDEDFSEVFDEFAVSKTDMRKIRDKVFREFQKGAGNVLQSYRDTIERLRNCDGDYTVHIPEIRIPAFSVMLDVSDKDHREAWEELKELLEDVLREIPEVAGDVNEKIEEQIRGIIKRIDETFDYAEQDYAELCSEDDDEDDDEE